MCAVAFAEKAPHHAAVDELANGKFSPEEKSMMVQATTSSSNGLFEQAMECFETALRAGMRLEEESVARCVEILRTAGSPLEWEKTAPAKVAKAIEATQQNVAQLIRSINGSAEQALQHMETALELRRRSFPFGGEIGDFWTSAVQSMRANIQIMNQANARVLEFWNQLAAEVMNRFANIWEGECPETD